MMAYCQDYACESEWYRQNQQHPESLLRTLLNFLPHPPQCWVNNDRRVMSEGLVLIEKFSILTDEREIVALEEAGL